MLVLVSIAGTWHDSPSRISHRKRLGESCHFCSKLKQQFINEALAANGEAVTVTQNAQFQPFPSCKPEHFRFPLGLR